MTGNADTAGRADGLQHQGQLVAYHLMVLQILIYQDVMSQVIRTQSGTAAKSNQVFIGGLGDAETFTLCLNEDR